MDQETNKKISDCLDRILSWDSQTESKDKIKGHINELNEYIKHEKWQEISLLFSQRLDSEIKNYIKEGQPLDVYLAHYTNLETVFSILNEHKNNEGNQNLESDISGLRAYDAFSLNDPKEGAYLKKQLEKDYKWLKKAKQDTEVFVCSFVSGDKNIGDNLKFWQAYGTDGLGCSIQPPLNFCNEALDPALYGSSETQKIKERFKDYFELGEKIYKQLHNEKKKKSFAAEFLKLFDRLNFLCKSSAYESEKEYRFVMPSSPESDIKYHFKSEGPYLRRYILDPRLSADKILGSNSKVIIGPRVEGKQKLCQNLKKLAQKRGLLGPEFTPSKIPYRKVW